MRYGMHVYNNYTHTGKMEKTGFVCQFSSFIEFFSTKCKKKQYVAIYMQKM